MVNQNIIPCYSMSMKMLKCYKNKGNSLLEVHVKHPFTSQTPPSLIIASPALVHSYSQYAYVTHFSVNISTDMAFKSQLPLQGSQRTFAIPHPE